MPAWHASILTLYPDMFPGPLGLSLSGRALESGLWQCDTVNIRDFAADRHRTVDDTPAGGGAGMVLRADVLASAIDAAAPADDTRPRLMMSPRGRPLTQGRDLEEVSIGDYVLSGGEVAAMAVLDACIRLIPGVMGAQASGEDESFENGLLEYPHYTRPALWEGTAIPDVLTSGDHGAVARWRYQQALQLTRERRPDLLADDNPPDRQS